MRNIITLLFILSLLVASVAAQNLTTATNTNTNQIEVPFTLDRHLVIIKGKINNKDVVDFIFDTGTTGIVLSETFAKKYQFKAKGFTIMKSPNGDLSEKVQNVTIPQLGFEGLNLKKAKAVTVKPQMIFSPTAAGIIGLKAFKGHLVTIDYKNSKLIFQKGSLKPNEKTIPIDVTNILDAKVNLLGKEVLANFDNGAPGFITIPMEWKNDYKLKSDPVLMGKGKTPGGEFEVYISRLDGELKIGSIVLKDPEITLFTGGFKAINFGSQFFKKYTITIDAKSKLMQIEQNK